jgi:eukaryotic-like serine/threonine-protein kinase
MTGTNRLFADQIVLLASMGEGVWRAVRKSDGLPVAARILRNHGSPESLRLRAQELARRFSGQFHPALIGVFDIVIDGAEVAIVTEFVVGRSAGSLAVRGSNPWAAVQPVAIQVATALTELHKGGFVHGLVCGESVVIDDADGKARLGEVATSSLARGTASLPAALLESHAACMAPEIAANGLTMAGDVYALGVLVEQLIVGSHDIRRAALRRMRNQTDSGLPDRTIPPPARLLLADLTAASPDDRPTAEETLGRLGEPTMTSGSALIVAGGPPHRETILHREAADVRRSVPDRPTVIRPRASTAPDEDVGGTRGSRKGARLGWRTVVERLRGWFWPGSARQQDPHTSPAPVASVTAPPVPEGRLPRITTMGSRRSEDAQRNGSAARAFDRQLPPPPTDPAAGHRTVWISKPPPPPGEPISTHCRAVTNRVREASIGEEQ